MSSCSAAATQRGLALLSLAVLLAAATQASAAPPTSREEKVSAAYFQTTKYVLKYVKPGPFKIDDLYFTFQNGTYDVARVKTYANSFGVPGLKTFAGVDEVVISSSKTGANFTWMPQTALRTCNAPAPFLSRRVSNLIGENIDAGDAANPDAYVCAFKEVLKGDDKPLFGIVDHNSAHNVSAALAAHAFRGSAAAVRVVLQYDNHSDIHAISAATLKCSNWGNYVVAKDVAQYFVHMTNKTYLGTPKLDVYTRASGKPTVAASLAALISRIKAEHAGKEIAFYVTVDRDFTIGSHTPWGDGPQTADQGRKAVASAVDGFLKAGGKLVGLDVVGLPSVPGSLLPANVRALQKTIETLTEKRQPVPPAKGEEFLKIMAAVETQAKDDVLYYYRLLHNNVGIGRLGPQAGAGAIAVAEGNKDRGPRWTGKLVKLDKDLLVVSVTAQDATAINALITGKPPRRLVGSIDGVTNSAFVVKGVSVGNRVVVTRPLRATVAADQKVAIWEDAK